MDKETVSGELLQAEISEPCAYGVADCFCILVYFILKAWGGKKNKHLTQLTDVWVQSLEPFML